MLVFCVAGPLQAQDAFRKGIPVLDVQAPATLATLEQGDASLAAVLGVGAGTLRDLYQASAAYRTLADAIGADVTALRQDMKANGRTLYEAVSYTHLTLPTNREV